MPLWALGAAASVALLAALANSAGTQSPGEAESMRPVLAIGLTAAGLVLGAWSVRHLLLHWLAWRPGSIHVAPFTLGSASNGANPEQLTMLFRRRLATLQIQSPTPMPGAAGASDFLDVLDRDGVDHRNPFAMLVTLLRAALPTHAYEVRGVLLQREGPAPYGVAVEVVRLPSEGLVATTEWGESWECVLRRAADEATAAILPQTRSCRSPWGVWRGYRMPGRLLHAYEEATRLEHERRYDEALEAYFDALRDDPINAVLRLRVGQLQERLGLFLDAFATYSGIIAGGRPSRVRRAPWMYRGHGRREQRRAQVSARYRRDVLLGGSVLAEQWRKFAKDLDHPTERDEQRRRLRQCLRAQIAKELEPVAGYSVAALLAEPKERDDQLLRALRQAFGDWALRDCGHLRTRMLLRVFDRRSTLTPTTVSLTEACIQLRLEFIRHRSGENVRWPPSAEELDRRISRIEHGRGRLTPRKSFRHWHEQYNAACAYALPLLVDGFEDPDLAQRAVGRLEDAIARADSAYIASRRDWLVAEDPDLRGLRATREFAEFEVMHLPSASITPRRPADVQKLESSRYMRSLLTTAATQWQCVWRERRETIDGGPDLQQLLEWFGVELRAWETVRGVACNGRHSGTRLKLIRNLQEGARRYGRPQPQCAFPRYEHSPLDGAVARDDRCDAAADSEVAATDAHMRAVCRAIVGERVQDARTLLAGLEGWQATLRRGEASARRAPATLMRRLCAHHAALWQLLGEWIDAPDEQAAAAAACEFRAKLDKTRKLWGKALERWDPRVSAAAA